MTSTPMRQTLHLVIIALLFTARMAFANANVAIFNFEQKAGDPEWRWLEKGLADMTTADFVSRKFSVVARDEMQAVANQLHWVPELALSNEKAAEEIRKKLKIQYIITGVYSVEGGKITINAQIIDVATRKEVFRQSVSAETAQVLALQRKLSSELLSWFVHEPAKDIAGDTQPWTRSIPAAKALYEGMHLYDQGKYADAWQNFRQAQRDDPEYLDALYWTARMYYFMDRYEHARQAYSRFVLAGSPPAPDGEFPPQNISPSNLLTTHPRLGDALKECLHTYEKLNAPPETLLKLYDRFMTAFPSAVIFNEMGQSGGTSNLRWLEIRSGQLLGQIGRHREAVEIAAQKQDSDRSHLGQWAYVVAMNNALTHHLLTGELVIPKRLAARHDHFLQFAPGKTTLVEKGNTNGFYEWYFIAAPKGHIFKSLHFFPIMEGTPSKSGIGMHIHKDLYGDVPVPCAGMSFADAASKGYRFDNLPPCGFFQFHTWKNMEDEKGIIAGMRVEAEFEKIGPHGAIEVACATTQDFRVDVDGRMGRAGAGLIGLLSPGEHTLRFYCGRKMTPSGPVQGAPFGDYITKVTVKEGETIRVTGRLPWKKDSPWNSWTTGSLIGHDYPGYYLHLGTQWGRPRIQIDDEAIRVVWSYQGDLWWSESRDGDKFTPPARFTMPISSGWTETSPRLTKDSSGRWILTFISDRSGRRENRIYSCWSRDFIHWSAPAMLLDQPVWFYDFIQDDDGRYLCVCVEGTTLTISSSRDSYKWETLASITLPSRTTGVRMIQGTDEGYEIGVAYQGERAEKLVHQGSMCDHIGLTRSRDGVEWSALQDIGSLESSGMISISMMHPEGKNLIACFEHTNRWIPYQFLMLQKKPDEKWKPSRRITGIGSYDADMTYHPRWGYVMAWTEPPGTQFPTPPSGPHFIRGPDLKGVLGE